MEAQGVRRTRREGISARDCERADGEEFKPVQGLWIGVQDSRFEAGFRACLETVRSSSSSSLLLSSLELSDTNVYEP